MLHRPRYQVSAVAGVPGQWHALLLALALAGGLSLHSCVDCKVAIFEKLGKKKPDRAIWSCPAAICPGCEAVLAWLGG